MEEDPLQEPEEDQPGREVIIIFAVFFEGGLAPLSLALGWLLGHRPLERFVWSMRDAIWGVVAAIPLTLMFLAMLRWPIGPLGRVKKFFDTEVVPLLEKSTWSEIALISLSAGVGEEMLFRGVLQAWLSSWLGVALGAGPGEPALRPAASDFDRLHGDRGVSWPLPGHGVDRGRKPADGHGHTRPL